MTHSPAQAGGLFLEVANFERYAPLTSALPMKTSQILRFKYKLPATSAVLMVLAALAVTVSLGYIAYTNPDIRITRFLTKVLSPEAPPFFFWGLTVLCFFASVIVIRIAIRSQSGVSYVELGPTSILVPKASISMSWITIPYDAIKQIRVINIPGQQVAIISSPAGESRLLSKSFAAPSEFTAFLQALQELRHG